MAKSASNKKTRKAAARKKAATTTPIDTPLPLEEAAAEMVREQEGGRVNQEMPPPKEMRSENTAVIPSTGRRRKKPIDTPYMTCDLDSMLPRNLDTGVNQHEISPVNYSIAKVKQEISPVNYSIAKVTSSSKGVTQHSVEANSTSHNNSKDKQPASLPTSINFKGGSSESQVSSSIPGLSSIMDMSFSEISEENLITMVKNCVKQNIFPIWKFYHKDYHGKYSQSEKTMCGRLMSHMKLTAGEDWWLQIRKVVVKTHTDHRNNCIKAMSIKFRGKTKISRVYVAFKQAGTNHPTQITTLPDPDAHYADGRVLNNNCEEEMNFLLEMRKNICHYAQILDMYAPCIVLARNWNNDANMAKHCTTTDRKMWAEKILSISDEAFLLLVLLNYSKRWSAELLRETKKERGTWTEDDENNMPVPQYTNSRISKRKEHDDDVQGGSTKAASCGWSLQGKKKYDELFRAVKADRMKNSYTFNQELLKVFQQRRRREKGARAPTGGKLSITGTKRVYRCMDEVNDTDDEHDDEDDGGADLHYDVMYENEDEEDDDVHVEHV